MYVQYVGVCAVGHISVVGQYYKVHRRNLSDIQMMHTNSEHFVSIGGAATRIGRDGLASAARLDPKRQTFQVETDLPKRQNKTDETCLRSTIPHEDALLAAQDVALGTFFTN